MAGRDRDITRRKDDRPNRADASGIDCVFPACFDFDFFFLATMLRCKGIRLHRAETLEQADFLLTATTGTVLLSDVVFLDGSLEDAVVMLAHVHAAVVPLVIADVVDKQFVSEVLARGACGVVWKPIQLSELTRTLQAADEASRERSQAHFELHKKARSVRSAGR